MSTARVPGSTAAMLPRTDAPAVVPRAGPTAASVARQDATVMGLVGLAHGLSHFFQLCLPPLFPFVRADLGVGYAALGLVMSVFYLVSGVCQTAAGFVVDRVGPRRVLLGGLALFAAAIGLIGLAPGYWALLPLAAVAGLGNSVFHPADYSILNAKVSEGRLGRAYGVHALVGSLGWAAAPVVVLPLAAWAGWRVALGAAAMLGLGVALALVRQRALADAPRPTGPPRAERAQAARPALFSVQLLLSPGVVACFVFFALLAFALSGVQTFMVSALVAAYDFPLTLATGTLTGYLLAGAAGVLAGGLLADRTRRHDLVAAAGMALAAGLMLAVASGRLATGVAILAIALAGATSGLTSPSRDMLIRDATPRGASGKVFGFVYSGLDLGSSTGPLLFGWLMDHGAPRLVFAVIAAGLGLTILTVVEVRRRGTARPAW